MRHHLRQEKACLNCGTIVEERFCTHCGQENIEPHESFGHLVRHFFDDFTHYDSKFFVTIRDLLTKPGFLTAEYLSGKRTTYLHPIRMYLFISFIFFLVVLSTSKFGASAEKGLTDKASYDARQRITDSIQYRIAQARKDSAVAEAKTLEEVLPLMRFPEDSLQEGFNFNLFGSIDYKFLRTYDSLQQSQPSSDRETGIKPWLYHRWYTTLERNGVGSISMMVQKTRNVVPKLMFILLPLFALILKLIYSRKKYYYADHAIFTLHFHCAVFLLFLFTHIVQLIFPSIKFYVNQGELILVFIYLIIALRSVYKQKWFVTILKSFALAVMYITCLLAGMMIISLTALL